MRTVIASAPGKINLALLVGAPTPDGYHPLSSIFEAVSLREYVVVEDVTGAVSAGAGPGPGSGAESGAGVGCAGADQTPRITVKTSMYRQAPSSSDRDNRDPFGGSLLFDEGATAVSSNFDGPGHLAVRAANLLAREGQSLQITVHKALPVAGGMAGGSADAAATLVAMNELNKLGKTTAELAVLGASLGADVPACVVGGLALGIGRGDRMEPLAPGTQAPTAHSRWWVAAFATQGLSTPQVFKAFDEKLGAGSAVTLAGIAGDSVPGSSIDAALLRGLRLPGSEVGDWLVNELEPTVFELRPELVEVGAAMKDLGAQAWMLSGSGPTIVGLAATQEQARVIAEGVASLPQVRDTAVVWGPGVSARVERSLPPWASASGGGLPGVEVPN